MLLHLFATVDALLVDLVKFKDTFVSFFSECFFFFFLLFFTYSFQLKMCLQVLVTM